MASLHEKILETTVYDYPTGNQWNSFEEDPGFPNGVPLSQIQEFLSKQDHARLIVPAYLVQQSETAKRIPSRDLSKTYVVYRGVKRRDSH